MILNSRSSHSALCWVQKQSKGLHLGAGCELCMLSGVLSSREGPELELGVLTMENRKTGLTSIGWGLDYGTFASLMGIYEE